MKRSMPLLAAALMATIALPVSAQTVLPQGSEIGFVSRQLGVPVEGRFTKWSAQISFDPKTPSAGSVSFTIDTGSATFGATETETEVRKPEWFHVAKFPQAAFQSTAIKPLGGNRYEVRGRLTIKGQTQPVTVPVTLDGNTATGSFTIQRLAYQIGSGEWADTSMVANDVQVRFKLQLSGLTS